VRACILFAVFFSLAACSSLERLVRPPQVALQSVAIRDVSTTDATAVFALSVNNPNAFGIHVTGLDYDLAMNGRALFRGTLSEGFDLAANHASVIQVPIAVNYVQAFDSIANMLQRGSSDYDLKGNISTTFVSVPYDLKGTIALPDWRQIGR
jgi:LEA14-like dessication related protein